MLPRKAQERLNRIFFASERKFNLKPFKRKRRQTERRFCFFATQNLISPVLPVGCY